MHQRREKFPCDCAVLVCPPGAAPRAAEVLAVAQGISRSEEARMKLLASGVPLTEFVHASPTLK